MKNNNFKHIVAEEEKAIIAIQKLKALALSHTEAQSMRERLATYADLHASTEEAPVNSAAGRSFGSAFSFARFRTLFIFSNTTYVRALVAGVLVLVLMGGSTGVSYAAEDSLPGQPLYAIKVSVAEPLVSAIITTTSGTKAEATWQSDLAARRLAEAATLASQNNLATSTQEYLQTAVATHVALAQEGADTLAASGDVPAALTVRTDLESKLSMHAEFLNAIASQLSSEGDATTTGTVLALVQNVDSQRNQVEISREATQAVLAVGSYASTTPSTLTATSTTDTGIDLAIATNAVVDTAGIGAEANGTLDAETAGDNTTDGGSDVASTSDADESAGAGVDTPSVSMLTVPDAAYPAAVSPNAAGIQHLGKANSPFFKLLQSMLTASSTASTTSSTVASTTVSARAAWITAGLNKLNGIPAGITNQNLLPQELQSATTSADSESNQ